MYILAVSNQRVYSTSGRVSVILTGYNQGSFFDKAVQSVLTQTHQNFELIIADNGSTDDTQRVLSQFDGDPRIRRVNALVNGPQHILHNRLVRSAQGEFVSFLAADDYYLPNKLKLQLAAFAELDDSYGVVYGPVYRHNLVTNARWTDSSCRASGWIFRSLLDGWYTNGPIAWIAPLYRKSCLLQHPFYEDVLSEGEFVNARISLTHQYKFLPEPVGVMTEHLKNTGKAIKVNEGLMTILLERLASGPNLLHEDFLRIRRFSGRLYRSYGWQGVRLTPDMPWALSCFYRSIRADPLQIFHPKILAGTLIALAPAPVRMGANRVIDCWRSQKENALFLKDHSI